MVTREVGSAIWSDAGLDPVSLCSSCPSSECEEAFFQAVSSVSEDVKKKQKIDDENYQEKLQASKMIRKYGKGHPLAKPPNIILPRATKPDKLARVLAKLSWHRKLALWDLPKWFKPKIQTEGDLEDPEGKFRYEIFEEDQVFDERDLISHQASLPPSIVGIRK